MAGGGNSGRPGTAATLHGHAECEGNPLPAERTLAIYQPAINALSRSYSSLAVASRSRQEVTSGRRRSSARRSLSVIPPQTPNSMRLSSASARHAVRTGHPRQISFALFCAAPWTNTASGSTPRQAAREVQSVIHMCFDPTPLRWSVVLRPTGAGVEPPYSVAAEENVRNRVFGSTVPARANFRHGQVGSRGRD